jgi:hypothetical protein
MVMPLWDDSPLKLPKLPLVTWGLIVANTVVFVVEAAAPPSWQAAFDAFADLRGGPALAGLFVGVESFLDASAAAGAVLAGETIEQAAMTLAAVAVAVAGLLVEIFLDARGQGIGVLDDGIGEEVRAHG